MWIQDMCCYTCIWIWLQLIIRFKHCELHSTQSHSFFFFKASDCSWKQMVSLGCSNPQNSQMRSSLAHFTPLMFTPISQYVFMHSLKELCTKIWLWLLGVWSLCQFIWKRENLITDRTCPPQHLVAICIFSTGFYAPFPIDLFCHIMTNWSNEADG